MHVVIDDTYGPDIDTHSIFVTGKRRTHVAVLFNDSIVDEYRFQLKQCIRSLQEFIEQPIVELHFIDIYNRNEPWDQLPEEANLDIFQAFAEIYAMYNWPVIVKTHDDRTLKDHGVRLKGTLADFDLTDHSDLSLLRLLIAIKSEFKEQPEPLNFIIDEGKGKAGSSIDLGLFHDYPESVKGEYRSSSEEPLLQIADFLAYCINRSTHLQMKKKRTEIDNWFLGLVGSMRINSKDLKHIRVNDDFTVSSFDDLHLQDRKNKGIIDPNI